jgi:hypothetical protein
MVGLFFDEDKHIVLDYSNFFPGVSTDTSSAFSEHQYVEYRHNPGYLGVVGELVDNLSIQGQESAQTSSTVIYKHRQ